MPDAMNSRESLIKLLEGKGEIRQLRTLFQTWDSCPIGTGLSDLAGELLIVAGNAAMEHLKTKIESESKPQTT